MVERRNEPGVWSVEAIDYDNDGSVYQAQFYGPDAEHRAREYASFKYGLPRGRAPTDIAEKAAEVARWMREHRCTVLAGLTLWSAVIQGPGGDGPWSEVVKEKER